MYIFLQDHVYLHSLPPYPGETPDDPVTSTKASGAGAPEETKRELNCFLPRMIGSRDKNRVGISDKDLFL